MAHALCSLEGGRWGRPSTRGAARVWSFWQVYLFIFVFWAFIVQQSTFLWHLSLKFKGAKAHDHYWGLPVGWRLHKNEENNFQQAGRIRFRRALDLLPGPHEGPGGRSSARSAFKFWSNLSGGAFDNDLATSARLIHCDWRGVSFLLLAKQIQPTTDGINHSIINQQVHFFKLQDTTSNRCKYQPPELFKKVFTISYHNKEKTTTFILKPSFF